MAEVEDMDIEEIKDFLGEDWKSVQSGLRSRLKSDISLLEIVNDSLLSHSGKQLRPLISLLMARACSPGPANDDSIRYAVAAELLHNATLLHDDVADKSDVRRGAATLRKTMGPSNSVLVGDFWLVRALRAILDSNIGSGRVLDLFASTLSDLAEGEMLQLQKASSCDTDMEDYLRIIHCKTASLFVASTLSAAISVNASADVEKIAGEYGRLLGSAFQIRDDIFDYMPGADVGKPVGVDIMEHKITMPLLCALKNMPSADADELRRKVVDVTPQTRDEIIAAVNANGGIQGAQKILEEYAGKAEESLSHLPASTEKDYLAALARYTAFRNK